MRMKFNKSSQLALVSAASFLAATLVTACSQLTQTLTVDFVYVASSKAAGPNNYGEINVYEINSESGRMRQIPSSPFPSAGRDPVAEAVSADYGSLFVVNQDDNNIAQFVIGTDGKLYPYNTVNTPGIFPLAIAANKSNLFVVDTYEPLPICSTADPCPGSIAVYPLSIGTTANPAAMGTPVTNSAVGAAYWPLTLSGAKSSDIVVPTAVNVLASGTYVYVSAYDSSVTPSAGYVFGFWVVPSSAAASSAPVSTPVPAGANCPAPPSGPLPPAGTTTDPGGTLCPLSGSPFAAGTQPSAIASDSTSTFVYVTDYASGNILGYSASSGHLVPLTSGTGGTNAFPAGNEPSAVVVDPAYPYVYVTNSLDATVTAYSMSNGALTSLGNYTTGLQPVAIGIDPSTEHFLYTVNYLGGNVSGFELSTTGGTLLESQYSPFNADAQPTAVAAIPHNGTGAGVTQ
jgi:6-phosphogluconolactonase (cycloisomerase 2 family)